MATSLTRVTAASSAPFLLSAARAFSSRAGAQSSRAGFEPESESEGERAPTPIQKLEEAVHRAVVRRSQPDWLPFRPGASYWVPPKTHARGYAHAMANFANSSSSSFFDDPEMVLASARGWPSSADYFIQGVAPSARDVKPIYNHTAETIKSEDEEG